MAVKLNKSRLRDTKFLIFLTVFAGFVAKHAIPHHSFMHGAFDILGYFLIAACALGRVYSTAFIGGVKNTQLIDHGPYSLCRNPLYFFSLLGAAGIGFMSNYIVTFAIIFFGFLIIYHFLIAREEAFLLEKFGTEYANYQKRVPRLLPSFKHYKCPAELPFEPKFLTKAVFDAIWWFLPLPLFELAEYLQDHGMLGSVLTLY